MSDIPTAFIRLGQGLDEANDSLADRRASDRFVLLIQPAKLIADNREYLCIVRNASAEGLKIQHFGWLPDTDHIAVELSNGEVFPAEVIWSEQDYAGLRFKGPVEFSRIVSLGRQGVPRRKVRLKADALARLNWKDESCTAKVRNLSQQGAAIEYDERLAIDQMVRMELEKLPPIFAKVRWRREGQYGLIFETPLSFEDLAAAMAALNA